MLLRELTGRLLNGLGHRLLTPEVMTFMAVGGAGYVIDVAAFNLLLGNGPLAGHDPTLARMAAVLIAMCVTYVGNRTLTWRGQPGANRRREVGLFIVFNIVGFGFSAITLAISHDLLGLTSRLADNVSANVFGLALGTIFRYLTYKRFVFATPRDGADLGVLLEESNGSADRVFLDSCGGGQGVSSVARVA